jgi:hypothetical protein
VAALGAVGLGACAVLAACSPVQLGAAAIVGNQRITVSTVDTQVANLQAAAKPYGSSIQTSSTTQPAEVLSWLIRFAVMDQVAAANGISVSQAQTAAGLSDLTPVAQQAGFNSTSELLVANGVAPQMFQQAGRWSAIQTALETKLSGGKAPTTQAQEDTLTNGIDKAQCTAAKTLNIQVSPQFGRFDYASATFGVVAAADTLSRAEPTPSASPASTEGLTPAAC